MKKRITALLLCLVMVFSLIPTSVWASELPVEPTKTPTFSDVKVQVKCSVILLITPPVRTISATRISVPPLLPGTIRIMARGTTLLC